MRERVWTKEQQDAIDSRNGTVLVSAAAGSGKTAVLVERIIQRLLDKENPCNADELLVVTFTRAAAAEVKNRIRNQISIKLAENPADKHLRKQQMLLDNAKICTIDSFCSDLVKENFNALGINPNYKLIEENELKTLKEEAINSTIDTLYEENSAEFKELLKMSDAKNSEKDFAERIIKINEHSLAYAFPELWLDNICAYYDDQKNQIASESIWGKIVLDYISDCMKSMKELLSDAIERSKAIPEIYNTYNETISEDLITIDEILKYCEDGNWDELLSLFEKPFPKMKKSAPKGMGDLLEAKLVKDRRALYKKEYENILNLMSANGEEHKEDMRYLEPLVKELIHSVKLYNGYLSKLKEEKNGFDFSDIMHMAVKLLIEPDENNKNQFKKTELAKKLSLQFNEILIDEYQDVNEAQDMLFYALSKDEKNLFMVGDAKQSIYGFRMAMPKIFISKREKLDTYVDNNYPAKVNLGCNFRSRNGITEISNFVFEQLMTRDLGDIDYNDDEKLIAASQYPEKKDPDFELHVLETREQEISKDELEAKYIARIINDMVSSGMTIKDGDTERKVRYGDFCVLQRSAKGSAAIYSKVFSEALIPAKFERTEGFFDAIEVSAFLSLLSIIDNPLQDIPMLSALISPIFGFTPDDLSYLRLLDKKAPFYSCLKKSADEGFQKAKTFLSELETFRTMSVSLPIKELISYLYEETGYLAIIEAMNNGEQRKENLYLLLEYADKYEETNDFGLSGFLRFIEKLKKTNTDFAPANVLVQAENVVHVMTIHKSKGLEFPICIISNCEKKFMKDDFQKGDIIICQETGIGIKRCNIEKHQKYNTLPYSASKILLEQSQMSEELRLLYVAMTRAKEKLIIVTAIDNVEGKIKDINEKIVLNRKKAIPYTVKKSNSFSDWILMSIMRHIDGYPLRKLSGVGEEIVLKSNVPIKTVIKNDYEFLFDTIDEKNDNIKVGLNKELLEEIRERTEYIYPYAALRNIISKRTASEFAHFEMDFDNFAKSRPAFLDKGGLTPAQKGTTMHKFMQFCNYENAKENLNEEIERLVSNEFISIQEAEILDRYALSRFFSSEIAKRIFDSNNVMREKKVLINMAAEEIDESLKGSQNVGKESVLIEGVADCVFEENGKLVILDFKTDHVKTEDVLIERYSKQLEVYKRAFKECTDMDVKETCLYSFELNKSVII